MKDKFLITDIDNTLYNFVDYFSPGFRAMVHVLHKDTEIPETILIDDFTKVFQGHGTIEYTFAIQELSCLETYNENKLKKLVHNCRVAFGRVHTKRLKSYSGIHELLDRLIADNWKIYAVTNAPLYRAYIRLLSVGLIKKFSGISAWAGHTITNDAALAIESIELTRREQNANDKLENWDIVALPYEKNYIKPNDEMFRNIVTSISKSYDLENTEIWALGDNVLNDLSPCASLGITTVWAKYGTNITNKNLDTMMKITPWQKKHRDDNEEIIISAHWDYTVTTVEELFTLFKVPRQLNLF